MIVDYYELDRQRAKEDMIDLIVREVGADLSTLVSPEGPWSVPTWNDAVRELGGERRRTYDSIREELVHILDRVVVEFDMGESIVELRDDRSKTRRLSQLLGIDHEHLVSRLRDTHGRTLLGTFVAGIRAEQRVTIPSSAISAGSGSAEIAINAEAAGAVQASPAASSDTPPAAALPSSTSNTAFETVAGYALVQSLGGGGMSEAWKATDANGQVVFLKRAPGTGNNANALQREQQIYERLLRRQFPHVVEVLDYQRLGHCIVLVTRFASGGTLRSFVEAAGGELQASVAKPIAQEILIALTALHREDVVHRDLKPENLLLDSRQWLLADFGIAKNLDRLMTQFTFQAVGTPGYAAPEQIDGAEAHPSADVYSFGKVVTYLLTGQTDPDRIRQQGWRRFARDCIRERPDERPSVDSLAESLSRLHA